MINPFKVVKSLIDDKVDDAKKGKEDRQRLKHWQEKFLNAKNNLNIDNFDKRERLYLGSYEVEGNVNNPNAPKKQANNVINIHYEFTETMVDTTIPQPSVLSRRFGYEDQAKMLEDSIKNDLLNIGIDKINDKNERTTQIQGYSLVLVEWDSDIDRHIFKGDLSLKEVHPKQFLPQPGVYDIDEMDYFFILNSVTKQYIKLLYGVDLENETDQYPSLNEVTGAYTQYNRNYDEKVTEVIVFYKDDEGDVGKFTYCNDVILEDLPKYYKRKLRKCKKCNKQEGTCECKNPKYESTDMEYETLDFDVQIASGEVLPAGTKIPYFVPKIYPIAMRINVPKNLTFGGMSDIDVVEDQQDAIKKMTTAIEEKILKGGTIITAPDTMPINLTNQLYQIIKGSPQELASFQVRDLQANVSQEIEVIKFMYESARSTLGVTEAFQGKPDPTATSGKAKLINIQQSAGRLNSKIFNKNIFFKRLFEIMALFKIAFIDEKRPYTFKDENGQEQYGEFVKWQLLDRDWAGELYYNLDFNITADAGAGLPKDKMWLLDMYMNLFKMNIITPVQLLKILSDLQLNGAHDIYKQAEQMQQQAQAMGGIPGAPGAVPPGAVPPGTQPAPGQQMPMQPAGAMMGAGNGTNEMTGAGEGQPMGAPSRSKDMIMRQVFNFLAKSLTPDEAQEFTQAPPEVQKRVINEALKQLKLPSLDELKGGSPNATQEGQQ